MSDDETERRYRKARPRQEDKLLPLGGFQFLILEACRSLDRNMAPEDERIVVERGSHLQTTALVVHEVLVGSGLEATVDHVRVALKRLVDRGYLKAQPKGWSHIDNSRAAQLYRLSAEGRLVLEKTSENLQRIQVIARKTKEFVEERERRSLASLRKKRNPIQKD
jgi:hypothetical protein